jgi:LDH2 family malate/lactate/ureidoglycolate dehydrogenase
MKINISEWRACCEKLFTSVGVPEEDAKTIVDAAITADLRGVTSHGTVRLGTYRKRLEMGLIKKEPQIKIENESPAFLHIDGDNGLGQVVAQKAIDTAMERAKRYGCCAVSIHNSNHMGMLSYYSIRAAQENMISNIMCNTPPFVAAIGGAEPAIGTNPICWGIPAHDFPIIMDMAISPARGKIKNALQKGELIPEGWALDKDGNPTTDPKEAMDGVLLPSGGVKGYGIGIIVEAFTGILSGASFGKHMTHPLDDYENKPNVGDFIMVFDVEKIMPVETFKNRVKEYVDMVKSSKLMAGSSGIFMPGEIEHIRETKMREEGIDIDPKLYDEFVSLI